MAAEQGLEVSEGTLRSFSICQEMCQCGLTLLPPLLSYFCICGCTSRFCYCCCIFRFCPFTFIFTFTFVQCSVILEHYFYITISKPFGCIYSTSVSAKYACTVVLALTFKIVCFCFIIQLTATGKGAQFSRLLIYVVIFVLE